ncbi:N-6 DNA methylase [Oxalobacteraceae sp. CFBP 8763]|nr:N-6 DNA methylase [Oxalobacteraceae sp. CFBP 8763]
MNTKEIIDRIFKEPGVKFELTEFDNLGKPLHEIINIYPKPTATGKDAGTIKYYLKSFIPFSSGNEEVQVYSENGKSAPEEIVRQLWVYKLITHYGYKIDEIDLEKSVQFGTEIGTKSADIIVYADSTKATPKIIVECKKPKRKDGIEQLKSYMNAKGAAVAVWSNGADSIILYRPYPAQFDDTLFDLPKRGEGPKDVLEAKKTLLQLKKNFDFKKILQDLEELVLADSGKDEFNEIFKIIFAKIWDEKEALENRVNKVVEFRKALDPEITYERINSLFHNACKEWPGIFKEGEDIELAKRHLQVCVGPVEGVRLMGSNLRIMDDAFEYLLPTEAKKKKGQFFTPRHVVEMCVRMLNPTRTEYVMDPSCGSAGFLLHAMEWCYPAADNVQRELRKHRYAGKYLWGIDFEQRAAKTSRALMLIAGDGHTNIFGPDVSSLDPKTWYETGSGHALMNDLRKAKLTAKTIPENEALIDEDKAWEYFDDLTFDVILANPPFAGEMKDRKMLAHYELAKPALKRAGDDKPAKEERDVLFIERILKMLKPGGRAAIVLPQGKFNNSSLAFIREWILKKARLLAVVGLHPNTFKPHTGTKTSVLFVQKYTQEQLNQISKVHDEVAVACPDYETDLKALLSPAGEVLDENVPEAVLDLIAETFSEEDSDEATNDIQDQESNEQDDDITMSAEDRHYAAAERVNDLKLAMEKAQQNLRALESDADALELKQRQEIDALNKQATGSKSELRAQIQIVKQEYKEALRTLKESRKSQQKVLKTEIKVLDKLISQAETTQKLLSTRGKLELVLADGDLIGTLKERWIAAEVAKKLDYSIFMAVSERGGKDNSGDYKYVVDDQGSLIEFPEGHRQEGQIVIDQDLVNFALRAEDFTDTSKIPDEQLCIAESFVRFAQEQKLSFWKDK